MRLDTWYYKDVVDQIGQMDLGEASLSARNGLGVAATHWLAAWWEGFRGLALPLSVRASYIKSLRPPAVSGEDKAIQPDTTPEEVGAWLETITYPIYSLYISFDLVVTVRTWDGTLQETRLPRPGYGSLNARGWDFRNMTVDELAQPPVKAWRALMTLNAVSLFRRSNAPVLQRVRRLWRTQLEHDPDSSTLDLHTDDYGIVTLADPPPGPPPDNQELYERNGLRLREAIAKWEQATGHPFEWEVSLEDEQPPIVASLSGVVGYRLLIPCTKTMQPSTRTLWHESTR
jgi:hypothetical protein